MKHVIGNDDLIDGLHPNPKGYDKITKEILKYY